MTDNLNNLNTNINIPCNNINGENAINGIYSLTSRPTINGAIITIRSATSNVYVIGNLILNGGLLNKKSNAY